MPSSSLLCPALNTALWLCFTQGLAKRRGEKTWEGVWHRAPCCVSTVPGHPRLIAEWQQTDGLRSLQERLSWITISGLFIESQAFVCVFLLFVFYNPLRKCQINKQFAPPHPVRTISERSENLGAGRRLLRILPFWLAKGHYSVLSKSGSSIFFFLRGDRFA